ncbi:MAG TPA: Cof-type HAD-IIB family hydrolase [Polyangiaceae bacterium]|nr:Cof-type HAD-IIB family hydrolase [Polyangiaceae bacterium]
MIHLVGIDVDGTLLGSSGKIHPDVWDATRRARAAGIHLALCSGRPAFGLALEYARGLDAEGWHVFQNGASIVDVATGKSRSVPLPVDVVRGLIARARSTGDLLELYTDDELANESSSPLAHEHARLLGVRFEVRPFESLTQPIVRAQWLVSHEAGRQLAAVPHPALEIALSTSPLMPETTFVGITSAGVSKGSAMRTVADEYRIPLREVMYVGDAENDLSALQIVGHPIAMANAAAAVLKIATRRVDHVDAGGLAQALELAMAGRS